MILENLETASVQTSVLLVLPFRRFHAILAGRGALGKGNGLLSGKAATRRGIFFSVSSIRLNEHTKVYKVPYDDQFTR